MHEIYYAVSFSGDLCLTKRIRAKTDVGAVRCVKRAVADGRADRWRDDAVCELANKWFLDARDSAFAEAIRDFGDNVGSVGEWEVWAFR